MHLKSGAKFLAASSQEFGLGGFVGFYGFWLIFVTVFKEGSGEKSDFGFIIILFPQLASKNL